jgi:hypothetical protein
MNTKHGGMVLAAMMLLVGTGLAAEGPGLATGPAGIVKVNVTADSWPHANAPGGALLRVTEVQEQHSPELLKKTLAEIAAAKARVKNLVLTETITQATWRGTEWRAEEELTASVWMETHDPWLARVETVLGPGSEEPAGTRLLEIWNGKDMLHLFTPPTGVARAEIGLRFSPRVVPDDTIYFSRHVVFDGNRVVSNRDRLDPEELVNLDVTAERVLLNDKQPVVALSLRTKKQANAPLYSHVQFYDPDHGYALIGGWSTMHPDPFTIEGEFVVDDLMDCGKGVWFPRTRRYHRVAAVGGQTTVTKTAQVNVEIPAERFTLPVMPAGAIVTRVN